MAEKDAKKREVPMLSPNRMQAAEFGRNIHLVTAESSENPNDFLQPEYWAHVAKNFRAFDHIELRTDDGEYWAEYLIISCDAQWAKVEMLREVKLQPVAEGVADDRFFTKYRGPHLKWCVIRKQDGSVLREGEFDRASAQAWLESYVRTIGKKAA